MTLPTDDRHDYALGADRPTSCACGSPRDYLVSFWRNRLEGSDKVLFRVCGVVAEQVVDGGGAILVRKVGKDET